MTAVLHGVGYAVMVLVAVAAVAAATAKVVVVLVQGVAAQRAQWRAEAYVRRRAAYDERLERTVPLVRGDGR